MWLSFMQRVCGIWTLALLTPRAYSDCQSQHVCPSRIQTPTPFSTHRLTPPLDPFHTDSVQQRQLQASLEECIHSILRTVNDRRDAIPPVVSSAAVTFPFDITISGEGGSVFSLDVVKRMLLTTNPPSVLH